VRSSLSQRLTSGSNFITKAGEILAFVMLLVVLFTQLSSLYVFPMPDTARWWGDETGQIVELKTELQEGAARIPPALGATVAKTNGIIRGNSWLAAFAYGLPAIIFSNISDLVSIGRTVTAVFTIALLAALFFFLRKQSASKLLALVTLLTLISTRSFLFASHAARLDIVAGLALLIYVAYLSGRYNEYRNVFTPWRPTNRWWFFFGFISLALATLSIHLLTLIAPVALFALWKFGAVRDLRKLGAALGGVLSVALLLFGIYYVSGAPITLFGSASHHIQFQSVVQELPILRPFSRSVQVNNLALRLKGFASEAPQVLIALVLTMLCSIVVIIRSRGNSEFRMPEGMRFLIGATCISVISWLLFQSYAIYYYLHILPVLALAIGATLAFCIERMFASERAWMISGALIIATLGLAHVGFYDALSASASGHQLTRSNQNALTEMTRLIEADHTTTDKPLVLAQNPATAWFLSEPNLRVMTAHFIGFPSDDLSPTETIRKEGVRFMLLYTTVRTQNYSEEIAPLKHAADSIAVKVKTITGTLFDADRDYFHLDLASVDTMTLYKIISR
jgi:hypothetical protein